MHGVQLHCVFLCCICYRDSISDSYAIKREQKRSEWIVIISTSASSDLCAANDKGVADFTRGYTNPRTETRRGAVIPHNRYKPRLVRIAQNSVWTCPREILGNRYCCRILYRISIFCTFVRFPTRRLTFLRWSRLRRCFWGLLHRRGICICLCSSVRIHRHGQFFLGYLHARPIPFKKQPSRHNDDYNDNTNPNVSSHINCLDKNCMNKNLLFPHATVSHTSNFGELLAFARTHFTNI